MACNLLLLLLLLLGGSTLFLFPAPVVCLPQFMHFWFENNGDYIIDFVFYERSTLQQLLRQFLERSPLQHQNHLPPITRFLPGNVSGLYTLNIETYKSGHFGVAMVFPNLNRETQFFEVSIVYAQRLINTIPSSQIPIDGENSKVTTITLNDCEDNAFVLQAGRKHYGVRKVLFKGIGHEGRLDVGDWEKLRFSASKETTHRVYWDKMKPNGGYITPFTFYRSMYVPFAYHHERKTYALYLAYAPIASVVYDTNGQILQASYIYFNHDVYIIPLARAYNFALFDQYYAEPSDLHLYDKPNMIIHHSSNPSLPTNYPTPAMIEKLPYLGTE